MIKDVHLLQTNDEGSSQNDRQRDSVRDLLKQAKIDKTNNEHYTSHEC